MDGTGRGRGERGRGREEEERMKKGDLWGTMRGKGLLTDEQGTGRRADPATKYHDDAEVGTQAASSFASLGPTD